MAYISALYNVGDTVYAYDPSMDTVQRLRITQVRAIATKVGYSSDWDITYLAAPRSGDRAHLGLSYDEGALHRDASSAFSSVSECAPEVKHV